MAWSFSLKTPFIAVFKLSTAGIVAGCMVKDGKIVRNEHCKIYRGDELVCTTEIKSVKIVKDDVKEAGKDRECGVKTPFEKNCDMVKGYSSYFTTWDVGGGTSYATRKEENKHKRFLYKDW